MTCRTPALPVDPAFDIEPPDVVRALFFGLGADGTVGANKNSTKILASDPGRYAQGYFVYDSKKSGSYTISHLRFGPHPIRAPYLLKSANFVGIHKFDFLYKLDMLAAAAKGATVLINSPYGPDGVWDEIPREVQQQIVDKKLRLHVIDASGVASGSGWLAGEHDPADLLLRAVRRDAAGQGHRGDQTATEKTYAKKGQGDRPEELRRDRQRPCQPARGPRPGQGGGPAHPPDARAGHRARLRAQRDGADSRDARRHTSRQRVSGRRHLSHRHDAVREAEHRRRGAGLGVRSLHPVRPVRDRLSSQRDPGQVLRREPARRRAGRSSRRRRSTPAAIPTRASRSRSTSRTAPAAASASRTVPRTVRTTRPSRPST